MVAAVESVNKFPSLGGGVGSIQYADTVKLTPPAPDVTKSSQPTFASLPSVILTPSTNGETTERVPNNARRPSTARDKSPSQKRERDDEGWEVPKTRKPRKTATGTSTADLGDIGTVTSLAGPVQFYIGNVTSKADKDVVKKVLETCSIKLDGSKDFEVLEVELLTKEDNPRTKCWRVEVPYKFKDLMEKDELYPTGWRHRKFFGSRKGREQKKARTEDTVLTAALQQQERVALLQKHEDERTNLNVEKQLDAIMRGDPATDRGPQQGV